MAGSEGVTIEGGTKRDARWQDEGALEGVINSNQALQASAAVVNCHTSVWLHNNRSSVTM